MLETFRSLDDLEFYPVAFAQRTEPVRLDCRVVHEHVLAAFLRNEAKALRVVEPLDRALRHCCHLVLSGSLGSVVLTGPPGTRKKAARSQWIGG